MSTNLRETKQVTIATSVDGSPSYLDHRIMFSGLRQYLSNHLELCLVVISNIIFHYIILLASVDFVGLVFSSKFTYSIVLAGRFKIPDFISPYYN